MSLWKVKFNHKDGENRKCKLCGDDFHATRPVWRCKPCTGKVNFETAKNKYGQGIIPTGKWAGLEPKKPYPFDTKSGIPGKRFLSIRTALSNAWKEYQKTGDKSVILAHYDKQLKEIQENGIMEWILDRRSDDMIEEVKGKSKRQINIEFPDTRGYYED